MTGVAWRHYRRFVKKLLVRRCAIVLDLYRNYWCGVALLSSICKEITGAAWRYCHRFLKGIITNKSGHVMPRTKTWLNLSHSDYIWTPHNANLNRAAQCSEWVHSDEIAWGRYLVSQSEAFVCRVSNTCPFGIYVITWREANVFSLNGSLFSNFITLH